MILTASNVGTPHTRGAEHRAEQWPGQWVRFDRGSGPPRARSSAPRASLSRRGPAPAGGGHSQGSRRSRGPGPGGRAPASSGAEQGARQRAASAAATTTLPLPVPPRRPLAFGQCGEACSSPSRDLRGHGFPQAGQGVSPRVKPGVQVLGWDLIYRRGDPLRERSEVWGGFPVPGDAPIQRQKNAREWKQGRGVRGRMSPKPSQN